MTGSSPLPGLREDLSRLRARQESLASAADGGVVAVARALQALGAEGLEGILGEASGKRNDVDEDAVMTDAAPEARAVETVKALQGAVAEGVKGVVGGMSKFAKGVDGLAVPGGLEGVCGGGGGAALRREGVDRAVVGHFLREGKEELARMFCEEAGVNVEEEELIPFRRLFGLIEGLRQGSVGECIEWVREVRRRVLEGDDVEMGEEKAGGDAFEGSDATEGGKGDDMRDVVESGGGERAQDSAAQGGEAGAETGEAGGVAGGSASAGGSGETVPSANRAADGGPSGEVLPPPLASAPPTAPSGVSAGPAIPDASGGSSGEVLPPSSEAPSAAPSASSNSASGSDSESSESGDGGGEGGRRSRGGDKASMSLASVEETAKAAASAAKAARDVGSEASARSLEFSLHSLVYLDMLCSGNRKEALSYAREMLAPFIDFYLEEVQALMACLLYAPKLDASPYRELVTKSRRMEIERMLTREYCRVAGLPVESPLLSVVRCGAAALPVLVKAARVSPNWRDVEGDDALPVEVEIARDCRHHSVFTCPVSKEEASEGNGPMILPCGHVLSRQSIARLPRANNPRFKCPYCPSEQMPSQCTFVNF